MVAGLAAVTIWRTTPQADDPAEAVATTGNFGRDATIEDVEVRRRVSPTMFWVVDGGAPAIFVVLDSAAVRASGVRIEPGARLTLSGEVRPVPPEAEIRSLWHLDPANTRALLDAGTYLHAVEAR